jgi:hypothetical protein
VRLSHPAPACGRGVGGEGQNGHPNASNTEFVQMFCPPLNPAYAGRGGDLRGYTSIEPINLPTCQPVADLR